MPRARAWRAGAPEVEEGILALRPRQLGDVVLVTAALRALKRGAPDVPLELVTDERFVPLVEGLPFVDRVWPLRRTTGDTLALLAALRRRRWRVAVDFFGNSRTALLARGSGAPRVVGYDLRGRAAAYHVRVPRTQAPAPGRREYAAATHVRLAVAAGGVDDGVRTAVAVRDDARAAAAALLAAAGVRAPARAIGLVAAGSWPTKAWPASHAGLLARRLLAAGREVVLVAGPGERRVTDAVRAIAPGCAMLPPHGVAELVAVIASLGAVVGTDSGPRHVAAALGVPTYAWYGPTHPDTWNPPEPRHGHWWSELPCRACDRTACPHWNCMPALDPADAASRVLAHLEDHGRTTSDLGTPARA
jgi:ADP-heptose:LPS heptosyltransferase